MRIPLQSVQLTVTAADLSGLLFRLNVCGIPLHHVCRRDELTVSFCIHQRWHQQALRIVERAGGQVESCTPATGNLILKGLLRRPILMLGGMLLLALTLFLPTRILFVTVSGNDRIPQREILAVASDCGVCFGTGRRGIRSEKVKNRLLSALPELQWVGVNTKGCVARISVHERALTEEEPQILIGSSLVASRDGVISEMTVTGGNPVCRVGQAVKKGQLLVSGYSDCGRCIYATRAEAEILAQTRRSLRLSMMSDGRKRGAEKGVSRKYGLILGKKRINFYKGSGISDTTCVRMYVEYPLTLPGGFQLPVALTVQQQTDYQTDSLKLEKQTLEPILAQYAPHYLESQMIAGKVEQGSYQITESEGAVHLAGQYICKEMIGQTRNEEIMKDYE